MPDIEVNVFNQKLKLSYKEEEKQRILDKQVDDEIYNLPNFPSKDAPFGKDESDNLSLNFKILEEKKYGISKIFFFWFKFVFLNRL